MMQNKITVKGRIFATSERGYGVFELRGGAYMQHRGTGQTPRFSDDAKFRLYIQRMLRSLEAVR